MTTSNTTTTISPADEVAARVSSPEIALATDKEASISMIIKRITMARGVLIMLMIDPLLNFQSSLKRQKKKLEQVSF
jgi:hypothetical protein